MTICKSNWSIDTDKFDLTAKKLIQKIIEIQSNDENDDYSVSFNSGYIKETEGYKRDFINYCKELFDESTISAESIGTGALNTLLLSALNNDANLVDWREKQRFGELLSDKASEKVLFDVYFGNNDEAAFNNCVEFFGSRYPLVSFLFFVKDHTRYASIRPAHIKEAFDMLGINSDCTSKCTWSNYCEYNEILNWVSDYISENYMLNGDLLDAQSFVWLTYLLKSKIEKCELNENINEVINQGELETVVITNGKEGKKKLVYTTKYERNPKLRRAAIKYHGNKCMACGFDFRKIYGIDYIEVHHVKPLYTLDEEVVIDPKTDLICLCANCHRIAHRKLNGVYSLEELKRMIHRQ